MADICSHKDESRKGVGVTAHAVASLRSLEDSRGSEALFRDPYAALMGGDIGKDILERKSLSVKSGFPEDLGLIDGLAVRTRTIDDEIIKGYNQDGFRQICVLGAGLDTRAWRLPNDSHHDIKYFEVDFPELFNYKLPLLTTAEAVSQFAYQNVVADLSLHIWPDVLIAAGFDPSQPTLWLLEGLIGYLTEDEANQMFTKITKTLSAQGSRMIATFLTPLTKTRTDMHRFFPENPLLWCNGHGWTGVQTDIETLGVALGRPIRDRSMEGYYIVVVNLV